MKQWLQELFDEYIADSLLWLLLNVKQVLPLEDMNVVQSMLYMLELLLTPKNTDTRENLEIVFNYCAVWALGGPLGMSDDGVDFRAMMSDYWTSQWKNVKFPKKGAASTVFDYYLDPKTC